jgi:hypothetical protein
VTAIAIGSVRSGGATTLAMTLAGILDDAVLVEADADGGVRFATGSAGSRVS